MNHVENIHLKSIGQRQLIPLLTTSGWTFYLKRFNLTAICQRPNPSHSVFWRAISSNPGVKYVVRVIRKGRCQLSSGIILSACFLHSFAAECVRRNIHITRPTATRSRAPTACCRSGRISGHRRYAPQKITRPGSMTLRIGGTRLAFARAIPAQEYERPELKWTQSSFIQPQMMVEDRYFYDPVDGPLYRRQISGRSGETLRRHRLRADLAGLSQHRHRQPQSVRHGARHAGRHRRRQTDGRGLSPPRRESFLSLHALGPGHTRCRRWPTGTRSPN